MRRRQDLRGASKRMVELRLRRMRELAEKITQESKEVSKAITETREEA